MIGFLLASLLLPGCGPYISAGTVREITTDVPGNTVKERQDISVSTPDAAEDGQPPSMDYVVGLNDVLHVTLYGKTEVGAAVMRDSGGRLQGSRVDGNGNIQFSMLGNVHVAGLTVGQIQAKLREALEKYIHDPWVVVEVATHRSKPLYLLGQFKNPGTYYMDRPLNLLQGIALGAGLEPTANLREARVVREGKILPVDVHDLLQNGAGRKNPWLRADDIVYVPDSRNQNVFVFGSVKNSGVIPMPEGRMTLLQAIAAAALRDSGYDLGSIRIIRSLSTTRGQLIVVDATRMMKGETPPYPLMNGDIVYVPKNAIGSWNSAMNDIFPSLQSISGLLTPFVQIKFLRE